MIEFGSDFHYMPEMSSASNRKEMKHECRYFATGRQAFQHLILSNNWDRIWIPEYFCYDVIEAIRATGIDVVLYPDAPGLNDNEIISKLSFKKNDVILRMNFFGLRTYRDNQNIPVQVIEDHSHDLLGPWSSQSNADWCVASIRKTVPMPEGGILWSPKQHILPIQPRLNTENVKVAEKRITAMLLKGEYIKRGMGNKEIFRDMFIETENQFNTLLLSDLIEDSKKYFLSFDFIRWNKQKRRNWDQLLELNSYGISILYPEEDNCNIFSYVILINKSSNREKIKKYLIEKNLYPAVLWQIPKESSRYAYDFSNRMLSIHCDARYSSKDIEKMKGIIVKALHF